MDYIPTKKVVISGGSGFLGTLISEKLIEKGYEVISLDIAPPKKSNVHFVKASVLNDIPEDKKLERPYAVINLAGKQIYGRWTDEFKKLVYDTRIIGTKKLIEHCSKSDYKPHVFISASAIGVYGDRGDDILDENSKCIDTDFLSHVAHDWEVESMRAKKDLNIRTVIIRNGHILGVGGILSVLVPTVKYFVGGILSDGKQWMSWIHAKDCVDIYVQAIEDHSFPEVINAVSSEPVTNKEFMKQLGSVLKRPIFFKIPKFAMRLIYKDFADSICTSQRVKSVYVDNFIKIQFPTLREALKEIFE